MRWGLVELREMIASQVTTGQFAAEDHPQFTTGKWRCDAGLHWRPHQAYSQRRPHRFALCSYQRIWLARLSPSWVRLDRGRFQRCVPLPKIVIDKLDKCALWLRSWTYSFLVEQFFFTGREHQLALISTQSLENALEDCLFKSATLSGRPWVLKRL